MFPVPWPYSLNREDPQAIGLVGWWPGDAANSQHDLVDMSEVCNDGDWNVAANKGYEGPAPFNCQAPYYGKAAGQINILNHTKYQWGTAGYTISFWVWPTTIGAASGFQCCAYKDTGSGGNAGYIQIRYSNNKMNFQQYSTVSITATSTDSTYQWYHYAFTRTEDGKTFRLWRNGIQEATQTVGSATSLSTTYQWFIGRFGSFHSSGHIIRDLRMYDRDVGEPTVRMMADQVVSEQLKWRPSNKAWLFGQGAAIVASYRTLLGVGI
jgi:hypothetical protein